MRRVAVRIAYLGKYFFGSQIQPGKRTVEGDIAEDLSLLHGKDGKWFDLKLASRTDRGVNAVGNVAVFNTEFKNNAELLRALNAVSSGVFYLSAADVDSNFNPRHAKERVYRYILRPGGIDAGLAAECAGLFAGKHDFSRFSRNDDRSSVIDMRSVTVNVSENEIVIEFRATHFLWNMIRRIVGAISMVGKGDASLDDVRRALNGEDRAFGLARPDALTLCDIVYDDVVFTPTDSVNDKADEGSFSASLDAGFYRSIRQ